MNRTLSFIKYNNAFPVALSILLLGAGGAFAASPDARDAVLSSSTSIVSVDNSYIANKDLSNFTPKVLITGVTEDSDTYTVNYTFTTIALNNYAWQDVSRDESMKVSKADIAGQDLGLYVTAQLKQIVERELAFLQSVQDKEKQNVTHAVVSTEYSGLVGKLLDSTTEELPGYTPIIAPEVASTPAAPDSPQPAAAASTDSNASAPAAPATSGTGPTLQILGANPASIDLHAGYVDLGVVITAPASALNLGIKASVDGGAQVDPGNITIDTSTAATHTIVYSVTDQQGKTSTATRTLLVGGGTPAVVPDATTSSAAADTTSSSSTAQ